MHVVFIAQVLIVGICQLLLPEVCYAWRFGVFGSWCFIFAWHLYTQLVFPFHMWPFFSLSVSLKYRLEFSCLSQGGVPLGHLIDLLLTSLHICSKLSHWLPGQFIDTGSQIGVFYQTTFLNFRIMCLYLDNQERHTLIRSKIRLIIIISQPTPPLLFYVSFGD